MIKRLRTLISALIVLSALGIFFSHAYNQVFAGPRLDHKKLSNFQISDSDLSRLLDQIEGKHCDFDSYGAFNPAWPDITDWIMGNRETMKYKCRVEPLVFLERFLQHGERDVVNDKASYFQTLNLQRALPRLYQVLEEPLHLNKREMHVTPDSVQVRVLNFLSQLGDPSSLHSLRQFDQKMQRCEQSAQGFERFRPLICLQHRYGTVTAYLQIGAGSAKIGESILQYVRDVHNLRDRSKYKGDEKQQQEQAISILWKVLTSNFDIAIKQQAVSELGIFSQDFSFIILRLSETLDSGTLEPEVIQTIITTIGKHNSPQAVRVLQKLANHENSTIHTFAKSTLANRAQ